MSLLFVFSAMLVALIAVIGGMGVYSRSVIRAHSTGLVTSAGAPHSADSRFKSINMVSKMHMKEAVGKRRKELRVLLFTAHPDDETMFFGPTLLALGQQYSEDDYKVELYMHCLSKGMNCGNVRLEEMKKAAPLYNVPLSRLLVDDLTDGQNWSVEDVSRRLMRTIQQWQIDIVLTFDEGGVSGHKNHIQCYQGALHLANISGALEKQGIDWRNVFDEDNESEPEDESGKSNARRRHRPDTSNHPLSPSTFSFPSFPPIYTLKTTPIYVKYASHLSFPHALSEIQRKNLAEKTSHASFSSSSSLLPPSSSSSSSPPSSSFSSSSSSSSSPSTAPSLLARKASLLFANPQPIILHQGMLAHESQYVWFRRLYILFSQYVFYNTLDPIE